MPASGLRWVAVPLVAVLMLADAAAPQYGIACLEAQADGRLLAQTLYQDETFISNNCGLNWEIAPAEIRIQKECELKYNQPGDSRVFKSASAEGYRFIARQGIAESQDNGQHWTAVQPLKDLSEAELAYREKSPASYTYVPGPLDVIEDPVSGNLLAAMGQEGILLGHSHWSGYG